MRKNNSLIYSLLIIILTLIFQNAEVLTQKPVKTPAPLRKCWQTNLAETGKTELESDNAIQIFTSYGNGIIAAIDVSSGKENWKSDLGGETLSFKYQDTNLYVLSFNESTKELIMRALSAETGVAKWQKIINAVSEPLGLEKRPSLLVNGSYVFILTGSGDLFKLSTNTGEMSEKISFNEKVTTSFELINEWIWFGTERKNLISYSLLEKSIAKFPLKEVPTVIRSSAETIIVGDRLGKLTAFKSSSQRKQWETRVGAEISVIIKTDTGLIVVSNDNFIYLISDKNGAKIWKKRFAGRTAVADNRDSGELTVAVNLNAESSLFLENKAGKVVNQVNLTPPQYFIGKPVFIGDFVVYKTNDGISAYSSADGCAEKEKT